MEINKSYERIEKLIGKYNDYTYKEFKIVNIGDKITVYGKGGDDKNHAREFDKKIFKEYIKNYIIKK